MDSLWRDLCDRDRCFASGSRAFVVHAPAPRANQRHYLVTRRSRKTFDCALIGAGGRRYVRLGNTHGCRTMSQQVPAEADDPYRVADDSWRSALARYIDLARQGAPRAVLRQAAMAVHEAALTKGRLARVPEGTGH